MSIRMNVAFNDFIIIESAVRETTAYKHLKFICISLIVTAIDLQMQNEWLTIDEFCVPLTLSGAL